MVEWLGMYESLGATYGCSTLCLPHSGAVAQISNWYICLVMQPLGRFIVQESRKAGLHITAVPGKAG